MTLNPFIVSIHLLVKTKQKLTVSHHTRISGLRSRLGCIGSRVMCCIVIIGGIRGSFVKLSVQWTNAFIYNSWCLSLFINRGIGLLEDFNRGQVAEVILKISFVVEGSPCPEESHDPGCIRLHFKQRKCNICQSPHEETMLIDRNAMNDVENQILHDADNFLVR